MKTWLLRVWLLQGFKETNSFSESRYIHKTVKVSAFYTCFFFHFYKFSLEITLLQWSDLWFLRIFLQISLCLKIFLKVEKLPPRKERSSLYCVQTSNFLFVVMWRVCKSSKIKHPGGSGGHPFFWIFCLPLSNHSPGMKAQDESTSNMIIKSSQVKFYAKLWSCIAPSL